MLLITALLAMVVTMAMLPPLSALARRVGLLAYPAARKVHEGAVPQIGGVAITVCALIGASFLMPPSSAYLAYVAGAFVVFALGLYDDYQELGHQIKFVVQFAAAALAMAIANITLIDVGEPIGVLASWLSVPIALVFLVGTTNAVNLTDGLDGLAGGLTLLSCLALAICGYESANDFAVIIPLVIAGGVVGFLRFNTYPAQIFMGNGGAYFLGFSLGFAASVLCVPHGGSNLVTVAMLLGVPVLDAAFVPFYRYAHNRPLFPSDRSHLHHRLLAAGFSHRSAVALIYAFHSVLVLAGFALRDQPLWVLVPVFAGLAGLIEGAPWLLSPLREALKGRHVVAVRPSAWLDRGLVLAAFAALLVSSVWSTVRAPAITVDFVACATLALIATSWWHIRRGGIDIGWPERVGLYVLGAYTIYFQAANRFTTEVPWDVLPFGVIGLFLIFRLIASGSRAFALTPLDALVVLTTAAIAWVGANAFDASMLDIVKLVIWFYAIEWLAAEPGYGGRLRALSYSGLGLIAIRGILGLIA